MKFVKRGVEDVTISEGDMYNLHCVRDLIHTLVNHMEESGSLLVNTKDNKDAPLYTDEIKELSVKFDSLDRILSGSCPQIRDL